MRVCEDESGGASSKGRVQGDKRAGGIGRERVEKKVADVTVGR